MGWNGPDGTPLPMTYRQMEAWEAFLEEDWNTPDRADWYRMQLTMETRRLNYILSDKPPTLRLEDFKLGFKSVRKPLHEAGTGTEGTKPKLPNDHPLSANNLMKAVWGARIAAASSGKRGKRPTRTPSQGNRPKKGSAPQTRKPKDTEGGGQ